MLGSISMIMTVHCHRKYRQYIVIAASLARYVINPAVRNDAPDNQPI